MSYLQFGGRRQNLKSSSLENLKIWNVLYVAGPTTLDEVRILDSFTFPNDPSKNIFDLSANKRFFELKAATEDISSARVPIGNLDVSAINIHGSFQTTGEIDGGFTKVTVEKNIEWKSIDSSDNLILFADKGNNYTDISGQSNLAVGYVALKYFSGNNNIVLGTLETSGNYYSGDNNIILGKNTTDSDISNSIILGNNVSDLCNNSIYLGNDTHKELYTHSNFNVYNGVKFGEDTTEKKFIFDNMGIGLSGEITANTPLVVQELSGTQGYTDYFNLNNSILLKSGKITDGDYDTSYNWEIVLQGNDTISKLFGWQKALTFIAPSGRSYYLRDDAFNDASFSTGGVPIFDASAQPTQDASGPLHISGSLVSGLSFTGQHSVLMENSNTNNIGKIVVSLGTYNNFTAGIYTNKPNMNESLPSVGFTTKKNDKRCFGVISKSTKIDEFKTRSVYNEGAWSVELNKNLLKNRCWVNSIGEGAVLVTNANGNFENGDFITTSEDAGYGIKQDDDLLHNYTVAKITEDMDFTGYRAYDLVLGGVTRKVCLVGCTYHCG